MSPHAASHRRRIRLWAGLATSLLVAAVQAQTSVVAEPPPTATTARMIVKYRSGAPAALQPQRFQSMAMAHAAVNRRGVQMTYLRQTAGAAAVMKLDRRVSVAEARRMAQDMMAADPDIEYAEPDRMAVVQAVASDPRYLDQWHYHEAIGGINLPSAWDRSTGTGAVVAVIDTGVRQHEDLVGGLLPGADFISDLDVAADGDGRDLDPTDPGDGVVYGQCGTGLPAKNSTWHGTHVSGTIAARTNNGRGGAGIAYGARVLPVRVLGKCGGYVSDIADAITWASGGTVAGMTAPTQVARILNLSLAGAGACDATLSAAIAGARQRGAVVVAAAANASSDAAGYFPANCPGVIAVAATNRSGGRASYSNFGSVIDIAAPGGDGTTTDRVLSTHNNGPIDPGADVYSFRNGTSMATPHVAGTLALMLATRPSATNTELESALLATARPFPVPCSQCGKGIVDAGAAVTAIGTQTTSQVTEAEPNDNRGTSQLLASLPASLSGHLASTSDVDFAKVRVPAGRTLIVTLTPVATANPNLHLFDASGVELARSTRKLGLAETITYTNGSASTVTWHIRSRYATGDVGPTLGAYRLDVRLN